MPHDAARSRARAERARGAGRPLGAAAPRLHVLPHRGCDRPVPGTRQARLRHHGPRTGSRDPRAHGVPPRAALRDRRGHGRRPVRTPAGRRDRARRRVHLLDRSGVVRRVRSDVRRADLRHRLPVRHVPRLRVPGLALAARQRGARGWRCPASPRSGPRRGSWLEWLDRSWAGCCSPSERRGRSLPPP